LIQGCVILLLAVTGLALLLIVVYRAIFVAGVYKAREAFTLLHSSEVIGEQIAIRLPVGDTKNIIVSNSPMHDDEILPTAYLGEQFLGHDYGFSGLCASLECLHPKLCGDTIWEKVRTFGYYGWMSSSGSVNKFWNLVSAKDENRRPHFYFYRRSFPCIYEMQKRDDRGTHHIPLQLIAYRSEPSALVLPNLLLDKRIRTDRISYSSYGLTTQHLGLVRHFTKLILKYYGRSSSNEHDPYGEQNYRPILQFKIGPISLFLVGVACYFMGARGMFLLCTRDDYAAIAIGLGYVIVSLILFGHFWGLSLGGGISNLGR
jgi:hypothetical protein